MIHLCKSYVSLFEGIGRVRSGVDCGPFATLKISNFNQGAFLDAV